MSTVVWHTMIYVIFTFIFQEYKLFSTVLRISWNVKVVVFQKMLRRNSSKSGKFCLIKAYLALKGGTLIGLKVPPPVKKRGRPNSGVTLPQLVFLQEVVNSSAWIKQAECFSYCPRKKCYCHCDNTVCHDGQYTLLQ